MNYRRLGQTALRVSELGFGGWAIGGSRFGNSYGHTDDNGSRLAIRRAIELGVTLFDTADVYGHGHSEALIGEVLGSYPEQDAVVATKCGIDFYNPDGRLEQNFSPLSIANAVEHSRARLKRDRLDILMLMNPDIDELLRTQRVWETLLALRAAGKIGAIGVSLAQPSDGVALCKSGAPIDAMEVSYNICFQEAAVVLFRETAKRKIGIIVREPLANGFLTAKYTDTSEFERSDMRARLDPLFVAAITRTVRELGFLQTPQRTMAQAALRFALDERGVCSVVFGAKTAAQVEENVGATAAPPITEPERAKIHDVFFSMAQ